MIKLLITVEGGVPTVHCSDPDKVLVAMVDYDAFDNASEDDLDENDVPRGGCYVAENVEKFDGNWATTLKGARLSDDEKTVKAELARLDKQFPYKSKKK